MEEIPLSEFRKRRLLELANNKYDGSKAALGRALGYRDGAFVGQMLRGERPITEKTVDQIHRLPGCFGWFDSGYTAQKPAIEPSENVNSGASLAEFFEKLPHDDALRNLVFVKCFAVIVKYLPGSDQAPTHRHGEHVSQEKPVAKHPA